MFSLPYLLVCELQGGASIWASNPGVCRGSCWRPQVWDGMGISNTHLSVELLLQNPLVMVSSRRVGKET